MTSPDTTARPMQTQQLRVLASYAAIYFVWGSTFLAIRYGVEGLPPFLLIGIRSSVAGGLLLGWAWLRGGINVNWGDWGRAALGGLCFFGLCHGSLAWAQQHVPSGLAAVVLALIPVWVVVLDWLRPGGTRPGGLTLLGMLISFAGVVALVLPGLVASGPSLHVGITMLMVFAALAWAMGTVYSRTASANIAPTTLAGMQLLSGGAMVLLTSLVTGEAAQVNVEAIEPRSLAALAYLIIFGSLLTFSAYLWLVRVSGPARVATYAYVNPVVAVLLGWAVAGEQLTLNSGVAMLLIVVGVVLIITARQRA